MICAMIKLRFLAVPVLAALALGACTPEQLGRPTVSAPAEPALRSTAEGLALVRLSNMHRRGDGVPRNPAEGVRLLAEAMEKGEPVAYVEMGLLTANGTLGVPKDEPAAVRLFERAWTARLPSAAYWIGQSHYSGRGVAQNPLRAREWYARAADLGEHRSQFMLGWMDERGEGGPANVKTAVEWYRKAASQNNPSAMNNLATMFADGRGVERNDQAAFALFERAANLENPTALNNLARWYRDGRHVKRDDNRAVELYRQAVRLGDRSAMNNLAQMYEQGRGVDRNPAEAARLYRRAAGLEDERGS